MTLPTPFASRESVTRLQPLSLEKIVFSYLFVRTPRYSVTRLQPLSLGKLVSSSFSVRTRSKCTECTFEPASGLAPPSFATTTVCRLDAACRSLWCLTRRRSRRVPGRVPTLSGRIGASRWYLGTQMLPMASVGFKKLPMAGTFQTPCPDASHFALPWFLAQILYSVVGLMTSCLALMSACWA